MTKEVPPELNRIADVVLNYRPKPKTKAQKKRATEGQEKGEGLTHERRR